jgi:hypothetical protein
MSKEKEDCPVSERLCLARMAEIKSTIKAYVTSVGICLAILEIVLRVWRP